MNTVFVPSGEASAILSQLSSSRLDLKRPEGLNGIPERYFQACRYLRILGLTDHPSAISMLSILGSEGVAMAMGSASSLDRFASVLSNADNVLVTSPQGSGLSSSGASPQGYTRPYQKDECKHHQADGRDGEDSSPLPTGSADLFKSDPTAEGLADRPSNEK